ncbi:28 kDa ribonucleoprotein, chloroplastic [Daldinia childiae]|uniref:28 kDa ribonucleoprotein, chloroplastic n=1 Tax=Daldinia childiae TaxID=326645 RepID=UPI001445281D|nr:28 kDa ribonucleoprotein, chloroplastic [Daldinia childiae]KAF3055948.1 28 kDa ribonucleoprotein, chloroplastic [Daldinia childiae]
MAADQSRPVSQKIPAGLATVLNAPEDNRDSAYYSSTDASSKHTSVVSGIGINVYHSVHDKTPSPTTTNLVPQPIITPASNMSVASMVSPTTPGSGRFDRPQSFDSIPGSMSLGAASVGPDSRRESVDSRINQGFGDLRLGGSPYASQNHSTTSFHGSMVQQRNSRAGMEHLAVHRISNGYQPNVERTPNDQHLKTTKTAPAITGPATSTIARAAEPTKGQAWAFPEEEIQRMPSTVGNHTFFDSRRSSISESIASSQFTTESRLPPGQRRLDDGIAPDFQTIHHHTLQHKQLSDLHSEESSPHSGNQPYSRTPELRESHKLAERKRRTEMKELFDQLRDLMPQERGSKASKWEILTKAIAEHQKQGEALKSITNHCQTAMQEAEMLRREIDRLRMENAQLRGSIPIPPGQGPPNTAMPSQPSADPYGQDLYGRAPRPELPPLRALSNNIPNNPDSMTGVQYDSQRPPNGYRQDSHHQDPRQAARAACSSTFAVAAPRQQIASFAMQICKANAQPATLMPLARYFSQTSRVAQDESERAAVEEAIESAGQTGSTANQDPEDLSNKIFVRNLPYEATDDLVKEAFDKYGDIVDIRIGRDPSGASKGYGFITFSNSESASRAIEEADNSFWQGRRLFVQPRTSPSGPRTTTKIPEQPTSSLYIGNIPYETSDADLNNIFRDLENVVNVRVAVDRNTGWPRGFAHADFKDLESAQAAYDKLLNFKLGERTLRIDYASSPKTDRPRSTRNRDPRN